MNTELAVKPVALEVLPPSALEVMQRSEIDLQIATAHNYPRSMQLFQSRARSMALMDEDTAAACIYSRPVGGGKFAEGLSIRAAEIVGASYGNLRISTCIIEQTERYVKVRGFAHDLESNVGIGVEVVESTVKKDGTPYDERMRIVIAKSALSKAHRDATFKVVPKALFRAIEQDCRKLALGEGQSVSVRRGRIVAWITKLAIDPRRVWKALGVMGEADLTDEHFLTLTGLKTSIADGDVTIDEAFPTIIAAGKIGTKPKAGENPLADAAPAPLKAGRKSDANIPEEKDEEEAAPPGPPEYAPQSPAETVSAPEPVVVAGVNIEPSAAFLRDSILDMGRRFNISKAMILAHFGGKAEWEALPASTLADALDNWPETKEAILDK